MSNCNNCENKISKVTMSSAEFEAMQDRHEREKRRMSYTFTVIIIVLILALVGSNAGWIYYESQFVETETIVEESYELDAADGGNAVINGEGSVSING